MLYMQHILPWANCLVYNKSVDTWVTGKYKLCCLRGARADVALRLHPRDNINPLCNITCVYQLFICQLFICLANYSEIQPLKCHCYDSETRRHSLSIDLHTRVHLTELHVNFCPIGSHLEIKTYNIWQLSQLCRATWSIFCSLESLKGERFEAVKQLK